MAKFSYDLTRFVALDGDGEAYQIVPDEVIAQMLQAEANVLIAGQQAEMASMGIKDTGETIRSVTVTEPKRTKSGDMVCYVYPAGSRTRNGKTTRNAEIAFINEYGKRGQAARPAISTANENYADAAVDAAANIYHAYMDQAKED